MEYSLLSSLYCKLLLKLQFIARNKIYLFVFNIMYSLTELILIVNKSTDIKNKLI